MGKKRETRKSRLNPQGNALWNRSVFMWSNTSCAAASGDIMKGIKACEALETKIKGASDKKAQKIYQNLRKARMGLSATLESVTSLMARVEKAEKAAPAIKRTAGMANCGSTT